MADDMSNARWCLAWAVAALVPAVAGAQVMVDPTRPPAGLGVEGDAGAPVGAPVLQSVMISSAVRAAIISGEVVRLGDKFGNARLVRISDNEVVLKEGSEEQVLKLYPGVQKTSARAGNAAPAAKQSRSGAGKGADANPAPGGGKR